MSSPGTYGRNSRNSRLCPRWRMRCAPATVPRSRWRSLSRKRSSCDEASGSASGGAPLPERVIAGVLGGREETEPKNHLIEPAVGIAVDVVEIVQRGVV